MTASEASERRRVRHIARTALFGRPPLVVADRYEVLAHIGRGGLGEVYRCRDRKLRRDLALKFVRAPRGRDAEEGELFREAIVLARLSHPNIVPVYDVGRVDDEVFIAMALAGGTTLERLLDAGPRPWPWVVRVFTQVADALASAHRDGVVHGDVKPQNLMVEGVHHVRVLDFGLARELAAASSVGGDEDSTRPSGTRGYLAPERHRGELNPATDQFAFAVAMYRSLWGVMPFGLHAHPLTREEIADAIARRPPPRTPRWLVAAVHRGLAYDPHDRFPSLAELRDTLSRGPRSAARYVGTALGLCAVITAAWVGNRPGGCDDEETKSPWAAPRKAAALAGVPAAAAAEVAAQIDAYADARAVLRHDTCEQLADASITPLLHELRATCVERVDFALGYALAQAAEPGFDATAELPSAIAVVADLAPCRADAVLLEERPRDADPDVIAAVNRGIDVAYVDLLFGDADGYLEGLLEVERDHADAARAPIETLWLAAHLGSALNQLGRHGEAATRLRAALRLAQRHPRWRRVEGMLLVHLGEALAATRSPEAVFFAEQAVATLEASSESAGFLGLAWRAVAVARLAAADPAGALEAIDASRRIAAPAPGGFASVAERLHAAGTANLRGLALERLGRIDEAAAEYQAGIAAAGDSRGPARVVAQLHNNLGLLWRDAGQLTAARRELELAAELKLGVGDDNGHAVSLMNLGNLEVAADRGELALAYYGRGLAAARTDATRVGLRFNRGFALQAQGRHREAIADYDFVLASGPAAASKTHRWSAQVGRGLARLAVGDDGDGVADLEAALGSEAPDADPSQRVEARLAIADAVEGRQPDRARALIREAITIADGSNLGELAARARASLAARGG